MRYRTFVEHALSFAATFDLDRPPHAFHKKSPPSAAVELCNSFVKALLLEDDHARQLALRPILHRSLFSREGSDQDHHVKVFSTAKASLDAHSYAYPVVVQEARRGNLAYIRFQGTAERGRIDKYFLATKRGAKGRPGPVHVFWPENGGPPRVVNVAGL